LYRVIQEAAVANIIGKTVVGGVFAATLTAALPCSAQTTTVYLHFGAPAVAADPYNALIAAVSAGLASGAFTGGSIDPYNAILAAVGLSSVEIAAIEVRFSGPMIYVDPYNTLLSTAVPPSMCRPRSRPLRSTIRTPALLLRPAISVPGCGKARLTNSPRRSMIPKKPTPHLIRGGNWFSKKIVLKQRV
jgi:hypothetical protein